MFDFKKMLQEQGANLIVNQVVAQLEAHGLDVGAIAMGLQEAVEKVIDAYATMQRIERGLIEAGIIRRDDGASPDRPAANGNPAGFHPVIGNGPGTLLAPNERVANSDTDNRGS